MMWVRWVVAACLTLLYVADASSADAQDQALPAEARPRFELGREAFERGDFAIALTEFDRVYTVLEGHPRRALLLYNIARCHEELGRSADAVTYYERFLAESGEDAPNRREAQQHLDELRMRVRLGADPDADPAAGTAPATTISPIGPVILGTGAAVLLAGAIVGGVVLAQDEALAGMCTDGACPSSARAMADEIASLALAADVLVITGAAVAVTGLLLTLLLHDEAPAAASGLTVGCGTTGCVLAGSF